MLKENLIELKLLFKDNKYIELKLLDKILIELLKNNSYAELIKILIELFKDNNKYIKLKLLNKILIELLKNNKYIELNI